MTKPQATALLYLTLDRMEKCGNNNARSLVQLHLIGKRLLNEHREMNFNETRACLNLLPSNTVYSGVQKS